MDNIKKENYNSKADFDIKSQILFIYSFWPYLLVSLIISLAIAYTYLRYTNYEFKSYSRIEIIDKAQDSEMALPTEMTVFNRSMINLENEIGVLSSYRLHQKVVQSLNSNVKFYTKGFIKVSEDHHSEWWSGLDYDLNFKIELDTITELKSYEFSINDNGNLKINEYDKQDELTKSYNFKNKSTLNQNSNLPFEFTLNDNLDDNFSRLMKIFPSEYTVDSFRAALKINQAGKKSDQLELSMNSENIKIGQDYLNKLMYEFDDDGRTDRQLEYKNTLEFVETRASILADQLKIIELNKQNFKEKNNITDISSNASNFVNQQFIYDAELFEAETQKELLGLLNKRIKDNPQKLLPTDIGIKSIEINNLLRDYNLLIKNREKYLLTVGQNNILIKNLNIQIDGYYNNILVSISNYSKSLDLSIKSLKEKENEFSVFNNEVPQNEKELRSIERELEIKEKLFLLLLQKKEEASINYAVVKPSIKIIDYARSESIPISPNKPYIFLICFSLGLTVPISIILLFSFFDTKINTKDQLINKLNDNLSVIGEIPHIPPNQSTNMLADNLSRTPLAESFRILLANLDFVLFDNDNKSNQNVILVTSSIKGEGKTLISLNAAKLMSEKNKRVIVIGADLRNPQLHKLIGIKKTKLGLSDYISNSEIDWAKQLIKMDNLDILLSGTIPPNPTELLSSNKFKSFIEEVRQKYDYVFIDSAPCLLISDTLELSKYVDYTLYVVRSGFSDLKLCDFINDISSNNKIKKINLVLNDVGNNRFYKYQYNYKYSYKYKYNYGYGYGYESDS